MRSDDSSVHPGLVLIVGAWSCRCCAAALRQLRAADRCRWSRSCSSGRCPTASLWQSALPRLHAHAAAGRHAFAPVRDHLRADGLRRRAVRARPAEPDRVAAAFVYAGCAIGVAFAGDLVTVFVFWELMAVGSTLVIWSAGTRAGLRAPACATLMIHLLGGVLLFAGIAGHIAQTGSRRLRRAWRSTRVPHWLILAGFLINAGAPPLSAWLPDAYPEASWSGTVFLSAFTTKTAVYVLLRGFPGTELLIWVGLFMVFYGIVYALLENDMRRILAY